VPSHGLPLGGGDHEKLIVRSSGLKKQRTDHSEKDRLVTMVVDRWCSFQYEFLGDKRKYPIQESLSFADAARRYIDLTRQDQLVRRDVAVALKGSAEFFELERKRVPDRVLLEADRLESMFFGALLIGQVSD
jgi:hypothetical protein